MVYIHLQFNIIKYRYIRGCVGMILYFFDFSGCVLCQFTVFAAFLCILHTISLSLLYKSFIALSMEKMKHKQHHSFTIERSSETRQAPTARLKCLRILAQTRHASLREGGDRASARSEGGIRGGRRWWDRICRGRRLPPSRPYGWFLC